MNKIHIVNWLLTRRCNLNCDYCAIVKNYKDKPAEYPDMSYYFKNEMSTDFVLSGLERLKKHNPDHFNIFYGGEPLLREDLPEIINYCNNNNIHYTIISNNTEAIQPHMNRLFKKTDYIQGFTASIDPIIYQNFNNDIFKKSIEGFKRLKEIQKSGKVKDVVAEITVTNNNLKYLYRLVRDLTEIGINSDITFVDIAKNQYYDFSNVKNKDDLVKQSYELKEIFNKIIEDKLNVHMRDTLLWKIFDILPSELDCGIEKNFHNLCVDSDQSIRMCLRCRGISTPSNFNLSNILDEEGNLNNNIKDSIAYDKSKFCLKCNHSCYLMSSMISKGEDISDNLIHQNVRDT